MGLRVLTLCQVMASHYVGVLLNVSDDYECGSPSYWFCPPGQEGKRHSKPLVAGRGQSTNGSAQGRGSAFSRARSSHASRNVFRSSSEDDDVDDSNGHDIATAQYHPLRGYSSGAFSEPGHIDVPAVSLSSLASHRDSLAPLYPPVNESRIIAPNVSKLSPHSAVEIRLQSTKQCVAVLCSVDVLKMRSGFFHDVLSQQDRVRPPAALQRSGSGSARGSAVVSGGTDAPGSTAGPSPEVLWRDAIIVPEVNPFEAAAYLESLHEGRALFRGEWNHCWARLSVSWVIEDLMLEYSTQIDQHMRRVVDSVNENHWRTNPNVLAGMRVAVFRKGSNASPTIVTGVATECLANIGYSKLRVTFDGAARGRLDAAILSAESSPSTGANGSSRKTPAQLQQLGMVQQQMLSQVAPESAAAAIIGDVGEPFWVQNTAENSAWIHPDDLFALDAKRFLTVTDKRIFWEMTRSVLELPELTRQLSANYVRTSADLGAMLKRPEFRVLWTPDAPEYIPKDIATELITAAYVASPEPKV